NISRTVGSIVGVAILVMFLNHQLLVEKEKINREVVTVIKKSDLSNLEREKVLQAINKKQQIVLKTDEESKIYKQLKEKYKQGIIRSYNEVFLMGSIIFFIAFAFNIGRVIISKKRSKRVIS
ncbi:drug:proton antiporter, partial [Bacillus cereus]|nr:drug:proton antiporter [Bacillus cereus]